jgi:hypothetical protein
MFRSLFQDHLHGSSFALSAYHASAARFVICLYWYVVVSPLFVFVSSVVACVLAGRALHDQTAHKKLHWIQIQTEGLRPHTNTNI